MPQTYRLEEETTGAEVDPRADDPECVKRAFIPCVCVTLTGLLLYELGLFQLVQKLLGGF